MSEYVLVAPDSCMIFRSGSFKQMELGFWSGNMIENLFAKDPDFMSGAKKSHTSLGRIHDLGSWVAMGYKQEAGPPD